MDFISVAYTDRQISIPVTTSPSPRKPAWVINDWIEQKLPVRLVEPKPVSREELARAHDRDYINGVMDCLIPNGFRGKDPDVAESLLWTNGSFLTASRLALENSTVACSPTSGFHHAGFCSGYGYCTFNGLLVAALALKDEAKVSRIGILDFDQHYGDGTAEIINLLNLDWVIHHSRDYAVDYPRFHAGTRFLSSLPDLIKKFEGCDLLMYQAGGDQHKNDPLGGFLTTSEMRVRDRIVFDEAKAMKLPVVWNLAGGYQQPHERIIEIHRNTMLACIATYVW